MTLSRTGLLLLGAVAAGGCNGSPSGSTPPAAAKSAATAPSIRVTARVAHVNDTLKVPTFAWIDHSQFQAPAHATSTDIAWGTLRAVAPTFRLSSGALASAHVVSTHDVGHGGIITRFAQTVGGVDVFRMQLNVAMQRDLTPLAVTGSLAPSTAQLAKAWTLDAPAAVAAAYQTMTGSTVSPAGFSANGVDKSGHNRFLFNVQTPEQLSYVDARIKKVWFAKPNGLQPAYYVELHIADDRTTTSTLNSFVVDAANGASLFHHDMTQSDYSYRVWADNTGAKLPAAPQDSPYGNTTPDATGVEDDNAPELSFVTTSVVTLSSTQFKTNNPWLPDNAPELSGNNVHAYCDAAPPDGYAPNTADVIVTPTSPGMFNRTWDPKTLSYGSVAVPNDNNIEAVTTQLFFTVNYMHDLFYDSGYDEVSGNAQLSNFGRGGQEANPVLAESQDYSGIDNANCSTPADGASPRIQMYLWDTTSPPTADVNAPAANAATGLPAGYSTWGPQIYDFTGNVVALVDTVAAGATPTNTGCGAFTTIANAAALSGNICLVDAACTYATQAKNCLKAGGVGMLVISTTDVPKNMGASGSTTSLAKFPSEMIGHTVGTALKTAVGANVTMHRSASRDGSVDGTIVSHEWGHSLSNRLIGDGNGLGNNQAGGMGEGWSDFVALLTYIRPTDTSVPSNSQWNGAYPEGAYATGGSGSALYSGIRRYPYSRTQTINPLTFKYIQQSEAQPTTPAPKLTYFAGDNSEVHATGEVWTTMLWDLYTSLLLDTADYTFDTASQQMRDYLVTSLKLTPINPTFTEARDAWLLAALANTAKPNDFTTFFTAFAGRGIGAGAVAPPRDAADNNGVTESFVAGPDIELASVGIDDDIASCDGDHVLDNGETGTLTVSINNIGATTLTAATVTVATTNPHLTFPGGASYTFPSTKVFAGSSVKIPVSLNGAASFEGFDITVTVDTPNIPALTPPAVRTSTTTYYGNYDGLPATSATDSNDAPTTVWTTSNDTSIDGEVVDNWARVPATGVFGQLWFGNDTGAPANLRLTSPPLMVSATNPFSFTFTHHYSFEFDSGGYYDGAVIELSSDGGTTWTDIGSSISSGDAYSQTLIDPSTGDTQALGGKLAFAGASAGYPADVTTTVSLGSTYAGQTVQIRFRVATDDLNGPGAWTGWFVDNMAFSGITNTPFPTTGPQSATCSVPLAKIGADQTVIEGTVVTLDGSGSTAGAGKTIHYVWTQTAGPAVTLSDATASKPTFTAPDVTADTVLTFQLIVNDGGTGISAPATGNVTVQPMPAPPGDMGGAAGGGGTAGGGGAAGGGGTAGGGGIAGGGGTAGGGGAAGGGAAGGGGGGGKHHSGCSATGSDAPTTALPLMGLMLLGLALRRRTRSA